MRHLRGPAWCTAWRRHSEEPGSGRRCLTLCGPSFSPTVSCPALNAPRDGRKFGSKYLVDHEVHFTCDPGFQLVGPSSVVCLPNGTWTGEQPHCRGWSLLTVIGAGPCLGGRLIPQDPFHLMPPPFSTAGKQAQCLMTQLHLSELPKSSLQFSLDLHMGKLRHRMPKTTALGDRLS